MMKHRLTAALVLALLAATPAAAHTRRLSAHDKTYLQTSAQGDMFEIYGGKMALQRSHSAAVRRLARVLVADHTKSLKETRSLAARHGLSLPSAATPSQQWELAVVSTYRGRRFNRWYTSLEVDDHKQDIEEAADEAANGLNPAVKADAAKEIPTLRHHLALSLAAWHAS